MVFTDLNKWEREFFVKLRDRCPVLTALYSDWRDKVLSDAITLSFDFGCFTGITREKRRWYCCCLLLFLHLLNSKYITCLLYWDTKIWSDKVGEFEAAEFISSKGHLIFSSVHRLNDLLLSSYIYSYHNTLSCNQSRPWYNCSTDLTFYFLLKPTINHIAQSRFA